MDIHLGSSPLTRGKPGLRCHEDFMSGLIPAHAGKTFAPTPKSIHGEAHPRSRGENMGCPFCGYLSRGSSPLTRGKRDQLGGDGGRRGLIPAHAGKTRA